MLAFSAGDELLTCGGFSLGETVHLGRFEFITDYFSGLSLSPIRSDSGIAFVDSTHSGPLTPRRAMTEDFNEEFHTASSGGGGSGLPSPKRLGAGALPAPITTLLWQEDTPPILSMTTVQQRALAPRPHTSHSFERRRTPQEG
jgi:hypothetical protein